MPIIPFSSVVPAANRSIQLLPATPSGVQQRVSGGFLSVSGDCILTFGYLSALFSTPAIGALTSLRTSVPVPFDQLALEVPPGKPLILTSNGTAAIYGHLEYEVNGYDPEQQRALTAATFLPSKLPACVGWKSAAGSQWQDNRATRASVTDARVYKWADDLLSLDGFAVDTAGNRLYRTALGGVRGDGIAAGFLPFGGSGTCGDFTLAAKVRRTGVIADSLRWIGPGWSASAGFQSTNTGADIGYYDDVVSGAMKTVVSGTVANTWYSVGLKREGGRQYVRGSGTQWQEVLSVSDRFVLPTISPSGGPTVAGQEILEVVLTYNAISDANWDLLNAYWGT